MFSGCGEIIENASLESYNTFGIKTSSKYLIKPYSTEELLNLMNELTNKKIKYLVLGKGSNVLLPDTEFKGAVISLEYLNKIEFQDNLVTAEGGISLGALAKYTIDHNLEGLHYLALIPGSLGGALYGNVGSFGHEIYEYVESVEVIRNNTLIKLDKSDIKYSYRYTSFKENNDIIVKATLKLTKTKNKDALLDFINTTRKKRLETQPLEYKNAGSVFKNPPQDYAGRLIESLNLKGYRLGDAEVSEKHANFIINRNNATSNDIEKLINYIKEEVYKAYKIELELEINIIKWD